MRASWVNARNAHFRAFLVACCLSATGFGTAARCDAADPIQVSDCRIKFIDQALLACERAGVIAAIDVKEGSTVRSGQRLIQLKDDLQQAELATLIRQSESAESDSKVKDAMLAEEFAIARYEIAVSAKKTNPDAVSKAEMLELKIAALRAGTAIDEKKLDLEVVRLKKKEKEAELRAFLMLSPFDGFVTRVLKQRGESVQSGDPVVEVVNPRRLRVEGYVAPEVAQQLRAGLDVEAVSEALGDVAVKPVRCKGKLVFVDVGVEPVSQRVRIWAEIENDQFLLQPGLIARLEMMTK